MERLAENGFNTGTDADGHFYFGFTNTRFANEDLVATEGGSLLVMDKFT